MSGKVEATPFTPSYEETPVTVAARNGDLETLQLLHASHASLKVAESLLGGLSQPEHLPALRFLLENGCSANLVGEHGMTPLQAMAAKKITGFKFVIGDTFAKVSLDAVKELVKHGADPSVLFKGRLSLADLANRSRNREVFDYVTKELGIEEREKTVSYDSMSNRELIQAAMSQFRKGSEMRPESFASAMGEGLQAVSILLGREGD